MGLECFAIAIQINELGIGKEVKRTGRVAVDSIDLTTSPLSLNANTSPLNLLKKIIFTIPFFRLLRGESFGTGDG